MMLKIAGGLILTLSVATCAAQSSHVGIAYQLYKSCYQGTLQAQSFDPDTFSAQDIVNIVEGTDQFCLAWTYAWYPAFTNNQDVTELSPAENERFDKLRLSFIDQVLSDLSDLLPANRKQAKKK